MQVNKQLPSALSVRDGQTLEFEASSFIELAKTFTKLDELTYQE